MVENEQNYEPPRRPRFSTLYYVENEQNYEFVKWGDLAEKSEPTLVENEQNYEMS